MKFHSRFRVPWKNKRKQILRNGFLFDKFYWHKFGSFENDVSECFETQDADKYSSKFVDTFPRRTQNNKIYEWKKCVNLSLYYEFITPRQLFTSFDLMNLLQRKLRTVFHFHIRFSSRILNVSFIYGCRG